MSIFLHKSRSESSGFLVAISQFSPAGHTARKARHPVKPAKRQFSAKRGCTGRTRMLHPSCPKTHRLPKGHICPVDKHGPWGRHILHNLMQFKCNANRVSVAVVKQPIHAHRILRFLPEYVAICSGYYGIPFFRLTFMDTSCILLVQVNIPFECLRMR